MAQHKSAVKRIRQNEKRRVRNKANLSRMKTLIKKVEASKAKDEATSAYKTAVKFLDQLASKGVIHKNKAANQKSRLTKLVNALQ
ncbi:MAG: 30S ribosomal protein S20 [Proteobacteria bacterium]|nr:30S ribosomal protein S20 [Pseudomonadota bacterium]